MTPETNLDQAPILEESEARIELKKTALEATQRVIDLESQAFALLRENKVEEARALREGELAQAREESLITLDAWLEDIKK